MTDKLTFLRSPSCVAAKIWTPGEKGPRCSDYQLPEGPFDVTRAEVASLADLLRVLPACPSDACHVRGKPIGDAKRIPYRRTKHHAEGHNPGPPTLEAEPHRTIPVDWDGVDAQPMRDLEATARGVRAALPAPFKTASCIAQATASAGIKPGARVRLWFFADRPVADNEIKLILDSCSDVDNAIYGGHQPVYVASPRFRGLPDPFPRRWVLLEGEDLVVPPGLGSSALTSLSASGALAGLNETHLPGQKFLSGGRNQALTSIAGTLRAKGLEAPAIEAALQEHNRTHCVPPLAREDVSNVARSVANYEPSAVPVIAKVSDASAERALRKQLDRLKHDAKLLPDAALHLKQHILDGTLTSDLVVSKIRKATKEVLGPTEILAALEASPVLASTRSTSTWQLDLRTNAEGGIIPGPSNLLAVFAKHPEIGLWYDSRFQRPVWERCPWGAAPREYDADSDPERARVWLEETVNWIASPRDPHATMLMLSKERPHDPFAGWLESLAWDGTPRMTRVASEILQAHDPAEAITFAWWLISAVARTFEPGCQVDYMIVLEGAEGLGKTAFLRHLAVLPRFYDRFSGHSDLGNPRVVAKLQGPVIVELAELAMLKRSDAETIKQFLDGTIDVWTPMYGRDQRTSPRRCVFAGTSNERDYLRSGENRRFWPIACGGRTNLPLLLEWRDQLWAEAVAAYRAGTHWYPKDAEKRSLRLAERCGERRAEEFAESEISTFLSHDWRGERPTTPGATPSEWQVKDGQVVALVLPWLAQHIGASSMRDNHALGRTLRALGWQKTRESQGGTQQTVWRQP